MRLKDPHVQLTGVDTGKANFQHCLVVNKVRYNSGICYTLLVLFLGIYPKAMITMTIKGHIQG